ncbi:MAG: M20/M25/M40 family metallo-hydrolase [Termitinemataceae bacterium]
MNTKLSMDNKLYQLSFASSLDRFRTAISIDTSWPSTEDGPEAQGSSSEHLRSIAHQGAPGSEAYQRALAKLTEFQNFLQQAYPAFHKVVERSILSPFSVLYRWPGAQNQHGTTEKCKETSRVHNSDRRLPVLFLAHYDVVPADPEYWTAPPFGAELRDGYVYGRGTLDTKNTLICALEAAEALIQQGFVPNRDIWFAFGGDEERSGACGAEEAARWFAEQGIRFDWTLDEGSLVALNQIPGIERPLALIGVEEKGFLDIELVVHQAPGHASRPPETQAAALLAKAMVRLSQTPFPYRLIPSVEAFFTSLAPLVGETIDGPSEKHLKHRIQSWVLSHPRLLGNLFFTFTATSPATRALFRTTLAMTQLFGAKADNILPAEARAILNIRILPGETIEEVLEYVRRTIRDDRVLVRPSPYRSANNPVTADPQTTAGQGPGWDVLTKALKQTFPSAVPIPFLVTATTDSRHYASLCRAVYRFGPLELPPEEIDRIHGHDERISIENFQKGILFYMTLIQSIDES